MPISIRKIGNFRKNASHVEAVRFSNFSSVPKRAGVKYRGAGATVRAVVPNEKAPLKQNLLPHLNSIEKDILPRIAVAINEYVSASGDLQNRDNLLPKLAGEIDKIISISKGLQMQRRQKEKVPESEVELPGNVVNIQNRLNFFTNISNLLQCVDDQIHVNIFWQPRRDQPSNLIALNFLKSYRSAPGIDPLKNFILVVRVDGKEKVHPNYLNWVLRIFIRAFDKSEFLCAGSSEADKRIRSYLNSLAKVKESLKESRKRKKLEEIHENIDNNGNTSAKIKKSLKASRKRKKHDKIHENIDNNGNTSQEDHYGDLDPDSLDDTEKID
jgi:hypothetical protein